MRSSDIPNFTRSMTGYERWLEAQLEGDVWKDDLVEKHRKMRQSAFVFLRATYWRWAETVLEICRDAGDAPSVIGVGDIHLENYGVWRDCEGRLVWGVNDFDEAAEMPFTVDLIRLATSAILSRPAKRSEREGICANILAGYREGLLKPRPFTLDEKHMWLRTLFAVREDERRRFWKKMDKLPVDDGIPDRYRKPIKRQMPGPDASIRKFARRAAGTGSLGRPRWVGLAKWRGGRLVREAKALVPSAWTLVHRQRSSRPAGALIAAGSYRAPDPWYLVQPGVVVRRLSPNARKIQVQDAPAELCGRGMLRAMGHELANVHLGTREVGKAIGRDLDRRGDAWLERAVKTASAFVTQDFEEWRRQPAAKLRS